MSGSKSSSRVTPPFSALSFFLLQMLWTWCQFDMTPYIQPSLCPSPQQDVTHPFHSARFDIMSFDFLIVEIVKEI